MRSTGKFHLNKAKAVGENIKTLILSYLRVAIGMKKVM